MTAPRRPWSFSLRTLFVVVTIAGPAIIGVKWLLRDPRHKMEAKAVQFIGAMASLRDDQLEAHATKEGDKWIVWVSYVPATPDADWAVEISANGKTLRRIH